MQSDLLRAVRFAQRIAAVIAEADAAGASDALPLAITAVFCTSAPNDAVRRLEMTARLTRRLREMLAHPNAVDWVRGWLSHTPWTEPSSADALITLIDALRGHIYTEEFYTKVLLSEGAITPEEVEDAAPQLDRCHALLRELEAREIDPHLLTGRRWQ
jgi:hypothetical protein